MNETRSILERLKRIPWLLGIDTDTLQQMASFSTEKHFQAGERVLAEGDIAREIYIVIEGQVDLRIFVPGRETLTIANAEPYDVIGWASMSSTVRLNTDSAYAMVESDLIAIDSRVLQAMCEQNPTLGYVIMRRLVSVISSRLLTTRLKLLQQLNARPEEYHA